VSVHVEAAEAVLVVTLDRPEVRNAIDTETSARLLEILEEFRADRRHRVAVLAGNGPDFCAGIDLAEAARSGPVNAAGTVPFAGITRYFECDKPIVAALQGNVLGGGLELALCADLRVADETARLGSPEVTWGFMQGAGATQRLPRALPLAIALEMLMTGDPIDAARAERVGLVNRVVPAGEARGAAIELAARIASRAPLGVRRAKEAALRGRELSLVDGLRLEDLLARTLAGHKDVTEGIRAFSEGRKPDFEGG
jgi:enoyl-CoA hydratase/carnithine racemase